MSTLDTITTLKPVQLAALVILMAEARDLSNNDLKAMANFTLTGRERKELEDLGLIESRKGHRQVLVFQLTEKGWGFCKRLHTLEVNVGRNIPARSIFVFLEGLHRSLDRLRVSHADFFKQGGDGAGVEATQIRAADVEARIRAAYDDLPKAPGGWVGLADLRDRLGDLDRGAVDEGLRAMLGQDGVRIIPAANTKALKPRDHAAALLIGEDPNHALSIGPT